MDASIDEYETKIFPLLSKVTPLISFECPFNIFHKLVEVKSYIRILPSVVPTANFCEF